MKKGYMALSMTGHYRARPVAVIVATVGVLLACSGCDNSPYPESDKGNNTYYTTFIEEPKHLDPARAYSTWDARVLAQTLEPPFQYHYLKRPYVMAPLTAEAHFELGSALQVIGRWSEAEASLISATVAAELAHDDVLLARSRILLVLVVRDCVAWRRRQRACGNE